MRVFRTRLIAVLVLVTGFALALTILGCRSSKVVTLPQTIKVGDILKWNGIDPKIGALTLTIPDGLCTQPPMSTHNMKFHVYIIKVGTQGGECTVVHQSGNSATAIPWYYKYHFEPAPGAGAAPASSQAQPAIEVLDIVGSCDGCGTGQVLHNTHGYLQEQVELVEDPAGTFTPYVVDGDGEQVPNIIVPPTKSSVYWQLQGPGALTFTFVSTSPCSNSNGLVLKGDTCNLSGAAPGPYNYYVSVDNYSSQYKYTLTIQPPPPAPTPKP
jgi:hypothetical protein